MNLATLSKEEILVILVAYKYLNKRNCAVLNIDEFNFGQESNESNYRKYYEGVKALFNKDFADITQNNHHERLVYSFYTDYEQRTIKINFGQNVRTIYSYFKKSIENLSHSYLDFNLCFSRVLFGLILSNLKNGKTHAVVQVQEYVSLLPHNKRMKIEAGLKKACIEISSKSPVNLEYDLILDEIHISIKYKNKRNAKRIKNRDLDTFDMFNGLTENDIDHYLKSILKDQYFYILYSFAGESRECFSLRIKEIITCKSFPDLMNDFEKVKKVLE